jgi:ribosomal protein S17
MKKALSIITVLIMIIGCNTDAKKSQENAVPDNSAVPASEYSGLVQSSRDVSNYTYLEIQGKNSVFWAAVPQTAIKKGDTVELVNPTIMQNFEAKTLGRKFDKIIFAGGVMVNGKMPEAAQTAAQGTPGNTAQQKEPLADASAHMKADTSMDASDVKKAENGVTIAEILANPSSYTDKKIVLRAKVVKFLPEIMKKNWLHLKDASVKDKDIVATTQDTCKVGDVVLIEGTVKTKQDFGFGYTYDVLLDEVKKK